MDWTLLLTAIGTVATIISTIVAVRSKNEAKKILNQIVEEKNHNVETVGDVTVGNSGQNSGVISGINTGEIHL